MKNLIDEKLETIGISKAELSRRLNISPQTLKNWRNRNSFPKNKILEISKILKVSSTKLLKKIANKQTKQYAGIIQIEIKNQKNNY